MEGEAEEVTTIQESIDRIQARARAEMEVVITTLTDGKTAIMTSVVYQNATEDERSAMLQGHLDHVTQQTPEADIEAIDVDSATAATAFDTALALLPGPAESAEKLVYQSLLNAGRTLKFLGYTIAGNPNWDVVDSLDWNSGFQWEDLADWLEDKGIDHPTIGVVDLGSLAE